MIYNDEATKIDSRESYPIDESVAKMLGWMQGSIRLEKVTEDEYGPIFEHMSHLYSLFYPLETHLQFLLDRAKHNYGEVLRANEIAKLYVENKSPSDAASMLMALDANLNMAYDQISYLNELAEKAQFYKLMIKQELAKNELSVLKIDQSITDKTGNLHITLNSLNDWAKQFGVTINDQPKGSVLSTEHSKLQPHKVVSAIYKKSERADALHIVLDNLLRKNPELKPARVLFELGEIAKLDNKVIISVLDEGVKWRRDSGDEDDIVITRKDALGERIRYWKRKYKQG